MTDCRQAIEGLNADHPLHALRIPAGWLVKYHQFYAVPFDHPMAWSIVCKDSLLMLQHMRRGVLVDLGWLPPEDPTGRYLLRVFKGDHCGEELHSFESRDRAAVITEIERLLEDVGSFRFAALGDSIG